MEHIVISALMTGILICVDFVPLLKEKDRGKGIVWFSVSVYAAALLIDVLVGLGLKIALDPWIIALFGSLTKKNG